MIVQLIHNPASGTHNEKRLGTLSRAFETCGAELLLGQTEIDGSLHIESNADLICVSGGDGALRLVIAAMVKQQIFHPLCVFPAGTVNLIAREIGYSSKPQIFAQEVLDGFLKGTSGRLKEPIIESDAGPFVACLSAGPDGVAVATHSTKLKRRFGTIAYAVSFISLFFQWPRQKLTLAVKTNEGRRKIVSCEAFYVAKGRHFAGSWSLSPLAGLGTNEFQLLTLSKAGRRNFLKFVACIATGRDPAGLKFVEHCAARQLHIEDSAKLSESLAFQVDGDPMFGSPANIGMTDYVIEYCLPFRN